MFHREGNEVGEKRGPGAVLLHLSLKFEEEQGHTENHTRVADHPMGVSPCRAASLSGCQHPPSHPFPLPPGTGPARRLGRATSPCAFCRTTVAKSVGGVEVGFF